MKLSDHPAWGMRKLPARKSIWKAGAAFQAMSLRLAVKVAV